MNTCERIALRLQRAGHLTEQRDGDGSRKPSILARRFVRTCAPLGGAALGAIDRAARPVSGPRRFPSDDSFRAQRRDLVARQIRDRRVSTRVGVLAEHRRRACGSPPACRTASAACPAPAAGRPSDVSTSATIVARGDLRIGEQLVQIADRAAGHTGRGQPLDPVARASRSAAARRGSASARRSAATRWRLVAKRSSSGSAGHPAEPAPLIVVADREDELAVRGGEGLVGNDRRMAVAHARRRRAGREVDARLIGQQRGDRIEHARCPPTVRGRSVRARSSAAVMPCAANMPDTMSAIATPSRNGGPSASPVMLIRPPSACMTASYPASRLPRPRLAESGDRAVDEPRDSVRRASRSRGQASSSVPGLKFSTSTSALRDEADRAARARRDA